MTGGELIDFLTRCVEELGPDKEAKWIWETPPGLNKYYYTGRYFYSSDPRFDMLAFAKQGIFLIQGDILEQEIAS